MSESSHIESFHGAAHALISTFEGIDGLGDELPDHVHDKLAALLGKLEEMPAEIHAADF